MNSSDFVQAQLSAAGITFASKGASVRISNGHFSYLFTPGNPVKVLSSEWRRSLSIQAHEGQPILEVAPPPSLPSAAPAAIKAVTAATRSSRFFSPAASHTDAPAQPVSQATQPAAAASAAEAEVK
jgi:hypothetical protein